MAWELTVGGKTTKYNTRQEYAKAVKKYRDSGYNIQNRGNGNVVALSPQKKKLTKPRSKLVVNLRRNNYNEAAKRYGFNSRDEVRSLLRNLKSLGYTIGDYGVKANGHINGTNRGLAGSVNLTPVYETVQFAPSNTISAMANTPWGSGMYVFPYHTPNTGTLSGLGGTSAGEYLIGGEAPYLETWYREPVAYPDATKFYNGGSIPSYTIQASMPTLQLSGTVPSYKVGGSIPKYLLEGTLPSPRYDYFISTLPNNLKPKEGDHYDMRSLWELNGRPQDFDSVKGKLFEWSDEDKSWHANSVAYDEENDECVILKSPLHKAYDLELKWYFSDEGKDFREKYRYDPISNKYINRNKDILFYKNGGSIRCWNE